MISMAAFFLVKKVYRDELVALAGSIIFLSVSAVVAVLTSNGTPPYLLTYLFGPLVFAFLWKAAPRDSIFAGLFLALVALSSLDSWLVLLPYVWIFVLTQQLSRRTRLILSLTPVVSLLIAFPYVFEASLHFASSGLMYPTTSFPGAPVSYLFLPTFPGIGPIATLLLVLSIALFFLFSFERRTLPIFLVGLTSLVAFFTPFELPVLGFFIGKSGIYPLALMVPLMTAQLIVHFPKERFRLSRMTLALPSKQIITVLLAALCFSSSLFTVVTAGSASQYSQLYEAGTWVSSLGRLQQTDLAQSCCWITDSSWVLSGSTASGGNLNGESFAKLRFQNTVGNLSASFDVSSISPSTGPYVGMVLRTENGTNLWARWISPARVFKVEAETQGSFSQVSVFSPLNSSFPMFLSVHDWNGVLSFGLNSTKWQAFVVSRIVEFDLTVYGGRAEFSNLRVVGFSFEKPTDPLRVLLIPRNPVIGNLMLVMNAVSPDGWFDQASPLLAEKIHLAVDNYSWADPLAMLRIFREWRIDYVFVQANIYYGPTSEKMPLILNNLTHYAMPIYNLGEVTVFALYSD